MEENKPNTSSVSAPDQEAALYADQTVNVIEGGRSLSQSKLEHLKDMAENLPTSAFSVENIFLPITIGMLFTAISGAFTYAALPETAKIVIIIFAIIGLILSGYFIARLIQEHRKIKEKRTKFVAEINQLISGICHKNR